MKTDKPISILVVEDNPGDFVLIRDYLEERFDRVQIVCATRFTEAARLLSDATHRYDAVLLDLSLPDKSGEHLVCSILQVAVSMPVLVLTGYDNIEFSIHSITLGISDYLLKDELNSEILYKAVIYAIERKNAQIRLAESEKRYSDLFHKCPQPMWIYDLDTLRFVQVNQAAVDQYGYSHEEFAAMTMLDIRPDAMNEKVQAAFARARGEHPVPFSGRFRHIKKNGDIIEVDIYGSDITLNQCKYRSVIAVDVTEKLEFDNKLTKAIIKTQEDERYEVGAELHDNVCQILATAQMFMNVPEQGVPGDPAEYLSKAREYISNAMNEIRRLSHRLAPTFIDGTSLRDAIQNLVQDSSFDRGTVVRITVEDDAVQRISSRDLPLHLYRVIQEQLRNIRKHAHATEVDITLTHDPGRLRLQIVDNGTGFDMGAKADGIGLANMRRRAELFGGLLIVDSAPGKGCAITLEIPEIAGHGNRLGSMSGTGS